MTRRYHLQLPFWIYTGMCVLVGSAAHTSGNNLLYWVFGALLAGLLISGLISGMMMMSLRAARVCPAHGAVGEPLIVRYALTNRSRVLPAFNVHIEEASLRDSERPSLPGRLAEWSMSWLPGRRAARGLAALRSTADPRQSWETVMAPTEAWVMHVAPRETVHGEAVYWPHRRSEARFDRLRLWTTFPFGIIKKSVTISLPQHTLVHPRVYELKREAIAAILPRGPLGLRVVAHAGIGDEYFGMRDYRPGDSMRHIAWKRAAGLDHVVSIERSQASPPKLRVILNLSAPTAELHVDAREPLTAGDLEERAISLAASLLRAADAAGYEVGLTIVGLDIPPTPLRRNQWHIGRMLAGLAGIELTSPRGVNRRNLPPDAERAGHIVIHPDRVEPSMGQRDAWHLTARQLDSLALRAIGAAVSEPAAAPKGRDSGANAAAKPSPRREAAA